MESFVTVVNVKMHVVRILRLNNIQDILMLEILDFSSTLFVPKNISAILALRNLKYVNVMLNLRIAY